MARLAPAINGHMDAGSARDKPDPWKRVTYPPHIAVRRSARRPVEQRPRGFRSIPRQEAAMHGDSFNYQQARRDAALFVLSGCGLGALLGWFTDLMRRRHA